MNRSKFFRSIIFTLILLLLVISPVLALTSCPKGKTFCNRPCRDYIDTNGNAVCDRIESSNQGNTSTNTPDNSSYPSNSYEGITDSQFDQGDDQTGNETSTQSSTSTEPGNDGSSLTEDQYNDDGASTTDAAETESSQNDVNTATSSFAEKNLYAALTEPIFLVMLILLLTALLLMQINYSLPAKLGLMAFSLASLGFYFQGCMCPVGVLANLPLHLAGILTGQYMLWLLLFLLPIVFLVFAGRIYCSGVCPFGAVQEFMFRLGGKMGLNKGNPGLHKLSWLRYLKYLSLLAVLLITPIIGIAWWCEIDPFYYLFNFTGSKTALYILIGLMALSLLISRPWCRFLCPYGALLGILNKDISLLKSQFNNTAHGPAIDASRCKNCGKCAKKCPVDAIKECRIDLTECIQCGECSQQCKLAAIT